MKKLLFIVNPHAGKAQIKNHLLSIIDLFIKQGYDVQVCTTQGRKDAQKQAEKAGDQVDLLVCSGGDGTLNEVINGLMNLDQASVPMLGYIPSGSTNDYASSLSIPSDMLLAARKIVEGKPYPIDIGLFCKRRHFVYIAAFGAFTEVSYMTPQEKKNILGHQAYVLEGVRSLMALKSYQIKVTSQEVSLEGDFIFGMITNTISVGGFRGLVTQDVALNDGLFEILLIRNPKTAMDFSNIVSYMFLKEEENEYVHKWKTKSVTIESEEPIDWVLDGEYGGNHKKVVIENLQKRLCIIR